MGGIVSKPKAPAPAPQPLPPPIEVKPEPVIEEITDPETEKSEQRRQNLLRRERGLLGTVQTSLSGALSTASQSSARKTLLGE